MKCMACNTEEKFIHLVGGVGLLLWCQSCGSLHDIADNKCYKPKFVEVFIDAFEDLPEAAVEDK